MKSPVERTWPRTASWKHGLDDVFSRSAFTGTLAEFRLARRHTFACPYHGAFELCNKRESFLGADCLWECFGCSPYRAVELADAVKKSLVRTIGHDAAVAVGKIGLDYRAAKYTDALER